MGNNSKLLKVNSVADNKKLESNTTKGNNLDKNKIDGFIFNSKNAKKIKRAFYSNFNSEIIQAQFDDSNSNIVVNFIDGTVYFYNNKLNNKSFF